MNDLRAWILSIDRCSLHDGPGIRSTVFLKGCPLACLWCHNPESQGFRPELFYLDERCRRCGACVQACSNGVHRLEADGRHLIDRSACTQCGRCVSACPHGALDLKGRQMTVAEVMTEVDKDRAFYRASGGGLTVSGGEPTAQFAFCQALLRQAHDQGIHTCIETSAYAPGQLLLELKDVVDLFLIDWKESDPVRHKSYTGVEQRRIAENVLALDAAGAAIQLRCPIIPGLNDRPDHFSGIAAMADRLRNVVGIEIMPYHPMGASKCHSIGREYALPDIDFAEAAAVVRWRECIAEQTTVAVV